jgi:AhpD family alkylhydroperoxidase
MSHVPSRDPAETPELEPVFRAAEAAMGFVPNSMLTMAHLPQLPAAFLLLASTAFGADLKPLLAGLAEHVPTQQDAEENLPPELVQLVALASSLASGCRYCQAHTSHNAHRAGADDAKLADMLNYATSPRFSASERAALDLAFAAGAVPNEVEQHHFSALAEHFSQRQITQLVAVVSLFGFLNRWNDTMATSLEALPGDFAGEHLRPLGWQSGKHG